jgi:hypothetical protein
LKLEDEFVPSWLIKEFFGSIDFDAAAWQDVNYEYPDIEVEDICGSCKEEASKGRRRAKRSKQTTPIEEHSATTTSSPSSSSEKGSVFNKQH